MTLVLLKIQLQTNKLCFCFDLVGVESIAHIASSSSRLYVITTTLSHHLSIEKRESVSNDMTADSAKAQFYFKFLTL